MPGSDGRLEAATRAEGEMKMRPRFRWVFGVFVLGFSGALVGVVPGGVPAVAGGAPCRVTAFVTNGVSLSVSTIDVKTRAKHPTDIAFDSVPSAVAVTPDGKTVFVTHPLNASVSTIDVKARAKHPTDITVGSGPFGVAVTPDGKTAFVTHPGGVSTIDVKTRTKHPTDIPVGANPKGVAITPDGKTVFVTNANLGAEPAPSGDSVSTIDVKTRTKHPTDIPVGSLPFRVAVTPGGKTAFVTNGGSGTVATIHVKTRTKHSTDITVGTDPEAFAGVLPPGLHRPIDVAVTPCHPRPRGTQSGT